MSAAREEDFSDYVEDTFDPGWVWTVGISVACLIINCSVPYLVRLGIRWDDRKQKQQVIIDIPDRIDTSKSEASSIAPRPEGASTSVALSVVGKTKLNSSVVSLSGISTTSSAMLSQLSVVLDLRPACKKGRLRPADNKDKLQTRLQLLNDLKDDDDDDGEREDQNRNATHTGPMSLLGSMDNDQVSVNDAIDAKPPLHIAKDSSSPHHEPSKEIAPLFGKKHILGGIDKLVDVADWDKEMKRVMWLAKPFTIQSFVESILGIITVGLIGRLLGVQEANAYITVTILSELTNTVNYGFGECLGALFPQADGAGNTQLIGQYWQLGTVFYTLGGIPLIVLWSFYTEPAILWFGFDEETARIGQGYAYSYTVIECISGVGDSLHVFLDCFDHEYYSTVVSTLHNLADVVAFIVMPAMGYKDLVLIGVVQVFVTIFITIANYWYATYRGWLDDVWEGLFRTNAFKNRKAIKNLLQQAIPLSASYILIYGEWELMTIFASFMGPAEVAAWGILGFLWEAFEYVTEGLADACEIRVSYHMGNGRPDRAKSCALKCILLGFQVAVFSTGVLYVLAEYIPKWVTPDPTLQKMIYETLPLIGIGQLAMNVGIMCWSVIGAQGRFRLATTIEFVASWFVVIPLSAALVFGLRFNLQGLVGATVLGYAISGATNFYVVLRSDWKKLSDIVVERHEAEESSSSSSSSASAEDDEGSMPDSKSIATDAASP